MPDSTTRSISVLVLDDHALFRESVARLLGAEPGLEVVGHCGSIEDALGILRRRHVDIVLLDFDLGEVNGMEFMNQARRQGYGGKVLVVTAGVERDEAAQLIRAGVCGIFMKQDSAASLAQGIRDAMAGKVWFEQDLLQGAMESGVPHNLPTMKQLTAREQKVLSAVFEGMSNKQIAGLIGASESSVKATLQQLFSKTGVRTRSQLVRVALERYKDLL